MKLLKTAPLAACFAFAPLVAIHAQTPAAPRTEIGVALGLTQAAQFDATASPLQFGGHGWDAVAHYARTGGRLNIFAVVDGGVRSLSPNSSPTAADEESRGGELRVGVRRALGGVASSFDLGLDMTARGGLTVHHYNDPTHSISDFLYGAATFGPSADWHHSLLGGNATIDMAVPLGGFVDHPYSDARTTPDRLQARFVGANVLHAVDGAASYSTSSKHSVGIELAYRLHAFHYNDVQPLRAVTQSFTFGIVRRFGGGDR